MRPLLVATIQRLPQRTIDSTFPSSGNESPRVTLHTPLGPWRTAVPPTTSYTIQPSIVVGFVSGNGIGLEEGFGRWSTEVRVDPTFCCTPGDDFVVRFC